MSRQVSLNPASTGAGDAPRPLKVAILTPAWPGGTVANGIVTYSAHLVSALRERGTEVFVLTGVDGSDHADPHVSTPRPERSPLLRRALAPLCDWIDPGAASERLNALAIVCAIQRLEREHAIDLVEMEESFGWCEWVASRCAVPVVARLHGPWFLNGAMGEEDTGTRHFRRRVRREGEAIKHVAGITAPSRDVLERTRSKYGLALPDAEVIPCPMPEAPSEERWNAHSRVPGTVLFVGRFDNHKGADVAIEAFSRIRSAEPAARLIMVGPDSGFRDANGRTWHILEFLEDRLPADTDRAAVQWVGSQPAAAIRQLRIRAAVTIVCSRYEIFGYTLVEAMSQGCPVVASAAGGLAELVDDGHTGLSIPPADPDALAQAVLRLLRDVEFAARLGETAAKVNSVRLSPRAIADRTLAYYRGVLARKQGVDGA